MNTTYDPSNWTFGAELELADVYRHAELPKGCKWNEKEYNLCSSNGVAIDPLGKLYPYGGEINTRPTPSIEGQVELFKDILFRFKPNVGVTHRCALHCWVNIPGLDKDVKSLKRIWDYFYKNAQEIFDLVIPYPKPSEKDFPKPEELRGAKKHFSFVKEQRKDRGTETQYKRAMAATTPQEFIEAFATKSKSTGEALWAISPRASLNYKKRMWEFRHFHATIDVAKFRNALTWSQGFLWNILSQKNFTPSQLFTSLRIEENGGLPEAVPFSYHREEIWKMTNISQNTRVQVRENLARLSKEGRI